MILKSSAPAPSLPEETVSVPELGGEVLVRCMLLKDRLALAFGDYEGFARMAPMLAACVFSHDDKGELVPLFTAAEWERVGGIYHKAATDLWAVANRLSDIEGETAKKKPLNLNSVSPAASP